MQPVGVGRLESDLPAAFDPLAIHAADTSRLDMLARLLAEIDRIPAQIKVHAQHLALVDPHERVDGLYGHFNKVRRHSRAKLAMRADPVPAISAFSACGQRQPSRNREEQAEWQSKVV